MLTGVHILCYAHQTLGWFSAFDIAYTEGKGREEKEGGKEGMREGGRQGRNERRREGGKEGMREGGREEGMREGGTQERKE